MVGSPVHRSQRSNTERMFGAWATRGRPWVATAGPIILGERLGKHDLLDWPQQQYALSRRRISRRLFPRGIQLSSNTSHWTSVIFSEVCHLRKANHHHADVGGRDL
jgi:hypothetical protein